ncbi:MAG: hypothetical protein WBK77_04065 [Alphaproteobacteria bacterium]
MAAKRKNAGRVAKSVYFEESQIKSIEGLAKKYNLSFSAIVCDAVDAQFKKSRGEGDDTGSQLRNLATALHEHRERTGQDIFLLTELMLSYIRFNITHTPGIPDDQKKAAYAEGGARFEAFLEQFQQNILSGKGIKKELFKDEE